MLTKFFGLANKISAIWNNNLRLGWQRLQTYEFTIVWLFHFLQVKPAYSRYWLSPILFYL